MDVLFACFFSDIMGEMVHIESNAVESLNDKRDLSLYCDQFNPRWNTWN